MKVLEIIKEPAFLITSHRIVVSTNEIAREQGIRLGDRCYITVGKRHSICPHCRLEDALKADHKIEGEVTLNEKTCMAGWLHLEDGLVIHYYRG